MATDTPTVDSAGADLPSLWRNRDYMILWSGQGVSTLGSAISGIALPLLILSLTNNSAALAGLAGFFAGLPFVIFSLPAGALVDRWNRKRVMILCDVGRGIALGSIPLVAFLGYLSLVQIYIAVLIEGLLFTFFNIAEVAALPRVVTKAQLPAASAQNQAGQIASFIAGPPIGGLIFQFLGHTIPYLFDSVSYAGSVVSLLFIRTEFQQERTAERRKLRIEIAEGLRWLWAQPLIRYMAFLTGGLNFVGSGSLLLIVLLAKHQHASASVIGVIFAIGSIGGILGSFLGPPIQKRFTFGQAIISLVWIQALLFPLFALAPNPLLLGVVAAGIFLCGPAYNVVQFSYRLSIIPDALQGRVNSSFRLLAFGFQPLGVGLTGILSQAYGPVTTVLIFGAIQIGLAIVTTAYGEVRNARPVHGVEQA